MVPGGVRVLWQGRVGDVEVRVEQQLIATARLGAEAHRMWTALPGQMQGDDRVLMARLFGEVFVALLRRWEVFPQPRGAAAPGRAAG